MPLLRISEWLLSFLANAAWQATLVALCALAADRLLRKTRARYRHTLWVGAIISAIALAFSASWRTAPLAATAAPLEVSATAAPMYATTFSGTPGVPNPAAPARLPVIPAIPVSAAVAVSVLCLYALLLLMRLGRLARAWLRTQQILQDAVAIELPAQASAALARCGRVLETGRVRVLASPLPVPLTLGVLRPVIVLPRHLFQDDDGELATTALGHELAHIARRDYLFNLIYEILSLPLWFHPALALMLRRIRQTREVRCDEIVTEHLQDARVYAQSLIKLAGAALPFGRAAATITVGIADADILEERVTTLLNRPRPRKQIVQLVAAALLFLAPSFAVAGMALRVHVHSAPANVTLLPAQSNPLQDYISLHQIGDRVKGTVVKMGANRAVIELAPEVTSVMRIPASTVPLQLGAQHDFTIVAMNPEERFVRLSDPYATSQAPNPKVNTNVYAAGGPIEGVTGGVTGGVGSGVSEGITGGVEGGWTVLASTQSQQDTEKRVKLAREKAELAAQLLAEQGNLTPQQQEELDRLKAQLAEMQQNGEGTSAEASDKLAREIAERAKRQIMRQRLLQAAHDAKVTMEQAIQIAQSQQAGTVVESRLELERGQAVYIVGILSGDDNNPTTTRFMIGAADGKVMSTFNEPKNESKN